MNFADIFKTSFLEGYSGTALSTQAVTSIMLITALISAYIFITYRLVNKKEFYNKNFNASLPALALITAGVILTIQSNIVISLGMVGALSIVRFRTAIKNPMDLVFLFWSIGVGIMCGASSFGVAIITSVIVTVGILLAEWSPIAKAPQILLINSSTPKNEKEIITLVKKYCSLYKVKARNLTKDHLDMAIEVRVKEEGELVGALVELENVTSASLVSHEGEVTF
ncbi:MAG: DUF4956 domain-containing protein [Lachnospiraceae bacterium]|nr:DUF4956 domain-containing protein [Lachnospiraceae bacterium]